MIIGVMGVQRRRSRRRIYIPDDATVRETRDPLPRRRPSTTTPRPRLLLPRRSATTLPYNPFHRTEPSITVFRKPAQHDQLAQQDPEPTSRISSRDALPIDT